MMEPFCVNQNLSWHDTLSFSATSLCSALLVCTGRLLPPCCMSPSILFVAYSTGHPALLRTFFAVTFDQVGGNVALATLHTYYSYYTYTL